MSRPRPELRSESWARARLAAIERDGHRCRSCGRYHDSLHVDHVKPWRPGDDHDDLENLQTLCPPCHTVKTLAEQPDEDDDLAADVAAWDELLEDMSRPFQSVSEN